MPGRAVAIRFLPATVQFGVAPTADTGDGRTLRRTVTQGCCRPQSLHAVVELHKRHSIGWSQLAQDVLGAALGFLQGAACHRAGAVDHKR